MVNNGFSLYQNYTDGASRGYARQIYTRECTTPAYRPTLMINYTAPIDVTAAPYSADPTGQTDSTSVINNAIAAAALAGGGTVYFPAGTYKVSGLLVSGNNVTLRGCGTASTLVPNPAHESTDMLTIGSCSSRLHFKHQNPRPRFPPP